MKMSRGIPLILILIISLHEILGQEDGQDERLKKVESLNKVMGKVERVELWLHNHLRCGGNNAYIEISKGDTSCKTGHKVDFDRGTLLSWNGSALGTCDGKYFNVEQDHLYFKIRSTSGNDFCPKNLTISIDNGFSYKTTGLDDWVDKNKGNQNRMATRIVGNHTILITTGFPYENGVKTEVITINEREEDVATTCSTALPDFPEQLDRAVGGNIGNDTTVICGGYYSDKNFRNVTDRCYNLEDNEWKHFGNMESARSKAGSLIVNGNLLIFGGIGHEDSMEWINANGQSTGTASLPAFGYKIGYIRSPAVVNVDGNRSIIIGEKINGFPSFLSRTWFYSHNNKEFTPGPELKENRVDHAAGVVTDKETGEKIIVVSGGWETRGNCFSNCYEYYYDSTELLIDGTWQYGPNMPRKLYGHKMVSIGKDLIVIGGLNRECNSWSCNWNLPKEIFKMDCKSRICTWQKLKQELKYGRYDFVAVPINIDCN